jgi:nucleotide-binding universal stress UspA family protein
LHLVRVVPQAGLSTESDHVRFRDRDDALRYLEGVMKRLSNDGVRAEIYVRSGNPAATVVDLARKVRAGMIAMTTRGKTTVKRGLFGGTAEKILRTSPQSLFILHASDTVPKSRPIPVKRILVPLDGSALSESILPDAVRLAQWHEARLILFYVRPYRTLKGPDQDRLAELCRSLKEQGVQATYAWAVGDAPNEILGLARRKRVGMIAMNSHGRGGFARFLLGSVAEEVIHGSDVPMYLTCHAKPVKVPAPKPEPALVR